MSVRAQDMTITSLVPEPVEFTYPQLAVRIRRCVFAD